MNEHAAATVEEPGTERPLVAVVGAGFSGTMTAVHLAARGARVVLIDRTGTFAQGLAYGTREPAHRLNVCAGGMSAYADRPDHFSRWLTARGEGTGASFASRMLYRRYLGEILHDAGDGIAALADHALALDRGKVRLESGDTIDADAVVVAAGNLPPQRFAVLADLTAPQADDPWSENGQRVIDRLAGQTGDVLLIGTGLTAVDTVLGLDARGFRGRIIALSRRGLLPQPHEDVFGEAGTPPDGRSPLALLGWVRAQSRVALWRAVVDALRPSTQAIWQGWTEAQRSRFLRHLRPWWDVHRHRIAPDVWARLRARIDEGRLIVQPGRIASVHGTEVGIRWRGAAAVERVMVAGVINCTGPAGDLRRGDNALVRSMLALGDASTDASGLGLAVDDDLRVLSPRDLPLYAVGPMARGAFWECVAVPEIRVQAEMLAATIIADYASRRAAA